jgi:enediyne biosynthesis protein E4
MECKYSRPKSRQEKVGAKITAIQAKRSDSNRHFCEMIFSRDRTVQNPVYNLPVRAQRTSQYGVPASAGSLLSSRFFGYWLLELFWSLKFGAWLLGPFWSLLAGRQCFATWKFPRLLASTCIYLHQLAPACGKNFFAGELQLRYFVFLASLVLGVLSAFAASESRPVQPIGTAKTGFSLLLPLETGIQFSNVLSDAAVAKNQILLLGSGVALGDVDGDGRCDVYLCRLEGPNVLCRNLGNWKFEDITGAAGVACPDQYSTGAVLADLDGDEDLDLLVNSIGGGTRCFVNDGKGRFAENTQAGFTNKFAATSIALADIEGDGDLDVYVANYRSTTIRSTGLQVLNVNGKRVLKPEDRESYEFTSGGLLLEHAEPDFLYLNDGKGKFTAVSWTGGGFLDEDGKPLTAPQKDWGLSVMFRDMNGDRAPDIYVCNDFWSPDRVWINNGHGQFRAIDRLALRNSSTFSMGVDFSDINRDGRDDFLVLDMLSRDHARRMRQRAMAGQNFNDVTQIESRPQVERNTLFLNRGDGTYAEIAQLSGLHASEWSWGIVFIDVDLDGYEDALITTGHGFDTQDSDTEREISRRGPSSTNRIGQNVLMYPRLRVPNLAFRNKGDLTFEEVSSAWGFDAVGVSHGIATADLDNDGDLDVVVNNLNAPAGIYRNNTAAPRIAVRLKRGVGARITVGNQTQEVISGGRYLSCDDGLRVFAPAKNIEVVWRSGRRSVISNAEPNRVYQIDETGSMPFEPSRRVLEPYFVAMNPVSDVHIPEPTNVISADLNGDGRPEMIDARDWGPIRAVDPQGKYKARWNALAVADFDNDGRPDLVATSWGRNTPFQHYLRDELHLYTGENVIEAYVDPKTRRVVPWRDRDTLAATMPWILERFSTDKAFGEASMEAIFGDRLKLMKELRVNTLDHMIFLNRGDHFEGKPLPIEAQFAPALAVAVGDFDGDGAQDIFLAENFFGVDPQTSRYDAGRGLWLRGDGKGDFRALSGDESGVKIYGEQTGVLLKDFDGDGKLDLAVKQNDAATKFYRNAK